MKKKNIIWLVVLLALIVCSPGLLAQAEQTPEHIPGAEDLAADTAEDPESEVTEPDVESSEVDYNEENFRRSMELRDANLQRSPDLTTGSYSPATGLQALDALPEASQKHLREQLREVIVENGPWTPEEAGEVYPYVPSAEAMENGTLEKKEQAAWGELVAKYHEREAALHASAGRSQAAERAAALAELLESGNATGSSSTSDAAPPMDQGVSQNALQLLTERQQIPAATAPVEVSQPGDTSESSDDRAAGAEDQQMDLESDGVIAIEDLEKVRLDPRDPEKD